MRPHDPALALGLALLALASTAPIARAATPVIHIYGSNMPAGSAFGITVAASDGSQSQTVPVELLRSSNTTLHFARFAFAGTVQVTIRVPSTTAYSISPRRYGITTQVDATAKTIRFTLSNDTTSPYYPSLGGSIRLIVHDHYGTGAKLFLFADREEGEPVPDGTTVFDATTDFGVSPGAANNAAAINSALSTLSAMQLQGTATLYFPPGAYATGAINMKDNVTLYVSGAAVLTRPSSVALSGAFVTFNGVRNAHLRGPGVVNANLWHSTSEKIVYMSGASQCSLEDATFTGTGNWSIHLLDCTDIVGRSYKIINEMTDNSDGTDPDHCRRVSLDGLFVHTKDDPFAIKTSPGSSLATDSITITNAVLWTEKSALKIGSEVTQSIRHVRFADNQIVSADRAFAAYGNGSGVAGGSVDGVDYVRNTVEKIQNLTFGKLVDFSVQYFSNPAPYAPLRNINVTDTFCYSSSPNKSTVAGVSGTPISNVHFERFWIDDAGTMVTGGNVGTYFTVGPNATNVTFTNNATPLAVGPAPVASLALSAPSPNPARGSVRLAFDVAAEAPVELDVLDVAGREVAHVANGRFPAGHHTLTWNGRVADRAAQAGVYFVRLRSAGVTRVRRLVLAP